MKYQKIKLGNLIAKAIITEQLRFVIEVSAYGKEYYYEDETFAKCYEKAEKEMKEVAKKYSFPITNKFSGAVLNKTTYQIYDIYSELMFFCNNLGALKDKTEWLFELNIDISGKNLKDLTLFCSDSYGDSFVFNCWDKNKISLSGFRASLKQVSLLNKTVAVPYKFGIPEISDEDWALVEDILGVESKQTGLSITICGYPVNKISLH